MKVMPLQKRGISDSRLILGCMGFGGGWDNSPITAEHKKQAEQAMEAALAIGITMFDHANIYTMGKAELVFGELLSQHPGLREQLVIQSKCGIRFGDEAGPGRFDFSREHILESVDAILSRLRIEYLDVLLLHRPDPLMEADEVAEAFDRLHHAGKVRHFGVSNMSGAQMRYLQSALNQPLVVNQLEMSLARTDWIDQGVHVNQKSGLADNFADGTLEYCMSENVQLQAWGPLAQGLFSGRPVDNQEEHIQQAAKLVKELADAYGMEPESIVLGWLMKHPARIQPVIGTVQPKRIEACKDAARAAELLTREQWYSLWVAARGSSMP